jgi:hypothetical protein
VIMYLNNTKQRKNQNVYISTFCFIYNILMFYNFKFHISVILYLLISTCTRCLLIQGVYRRMVRVQKFIKRLHSATGRCSPTFSQECKRATQSCSPTALDRTCCKWRQLHTHTIWDEFDYRVDVCRVTQSAHIEGL